MSLLYLIIPNPTGQNSFRARVKLGPQVQIPQNTAGWDTSLVFIYQSALTHI